MYYISHFVYYHDGADSLTPSTCTCTMYIHPECTSTSMVIPLLSSSNRKDSFLLDDLLIVF